MYYAGNSPNLDMTLQGRGLTREHLHTQSHEIQILRLLHSIVSNKGRHDFTRLHNYQVKIVIWDAQKCPTYLSSLSFVLSTYLTALIMTVAKISHHLLYSQLFNVTMLLNLYIEHIYKHEKNRKKTSQTLSSDLAHIAWLLGSKKTYAKEKWCQQQVPQWSKSWIQSMAKQSPTKLWRCSFNL